MPMTGILPYTQKRVMQPMPAPVPSGGGKGAGIIPGLFSDILLGIATQGMGSGLSALFHTMPAAGPMEYFYKSMMAQPLFPVP